MENDAEKGEIIEKKRRDDDEQCDWASKIKLVYKGIRAKEFRFTGNLIAINTSMILANFTPHTEMREEVIYSSNLKIHGGAGEIFQQNIKYVYQFRRNPSIHQRM